MKTLTIILIAILIALTTSAQTTISVPQYPDSVKHKVAVSLCWNNILMAVNFAKSQGMTVEEYGKYAGQQAIPYWSMDMEFKQFAYNFIGSWAIMSKGVEILSQTDNKIVFRIAKVYPMIEEQESFVSVTFKELITYMEALYIQICDHLGLKLKLEITPEGVISSIEKEINTLKAKKS